LITVNDVERSIFEWAPRELSMKGDINGLAAGNRGAAVARVLVSLDVTQKTISEAVSLKAGLLVAHHPIAWGESAPWPNSDTGAGNILLSLCAAGVAAITMHTNLDAARGGINDVLASKVGLKDVFTFDEKEGLGRMGVLPSKLPVKSFAGLCKDALGSGVVRYFDAGRPSERVAVCSGAGGFILEDAIRAGCDTFLSGELKHSMFLTAQNYGINLLCCGHFATENIITPVLTGFIREKFPQLTVTLSSETAEPFQCL
jgi:dinuclear metal center YbgI/SA1388 family protein